MSRIIKIGLIGCGAIVEKYHLPVLKKISGVKVHALVDKNLKRIKQLQTQYQTEKITDDYRQILDEIDIALIALPNYLHASVSIDFLRKGVHVFCEKPMAINFKEAQKMVKVASLNKRKLGAGMVRRYFEVDQKIKQLLDSNYMGKIKSFEYEEGFPFSWPLQSTYAFDKKQAGGGVLIDMGAHAIDLIIWLFGKPTKIEYRDDSRGEIEANCQIDFRFEDITGKIELSRDRTLRNTFKIIGQKGDLEIPSGGLTNLFIRKNNHQEKFTSSEIFEDCIFKELSEFVNAVRNNSRLFISGQEVIDSIKVIDYCYSYKKQIYEPWFEI